MLPTVILPGYLAGASDYHELEQSLKAQGIPTTTVPLRWLDWVPTLGGRSVTCILRQIDATVQRMLTQHQAEKINLVGHSAGGWLGRIYLGEKPYCVHPQDDETCVWRGCDRIATLLTLGTPHTSQERWTRRNLDFVNQTYPGAFYPQIRYVCVAGKAVYGQRRPGQWLAYSSYKLTCGEGNGWGDGITPVAAAHLEGAKNIVLEGVYHSPRPDRRWYGSPSAISEWITELMP